MRTNLPEDRSVEIGARTPAEAASTPRSRTLTLSLSQPSHPAPPPREKESRTLPGPIALLSLFVIAASLLALLSPAAVATENAPSPTFPPTSAPATGCRLESTTIAPAAPKAPELRRSLERIDLGPADRAALVALAAWLEGERAESEATIGAIVAADPSAPLARYARAIVRRGRGDFDGAAADLLEAARRAPDEPAFLVELARTESARPNYAAAARAYESALALASDDADVAALVAAFYLDHALRTDRAEEIARAMTARAADDHRGWTLLGRGLAMQGRLDEAADALRRARALGSTGDAAGRLERVERCRADASARRGQAAPGGGLLGAFLARIVHSSR